MLLRALRFIDDALWRMARFFGRTTESYIDVETWLDDHTLVCRDGALLSLIDIGGYRVLTGGDTDEFDQLIETLRLAMAPQFASDGYRFQLIYHRDPSPSAVEHLLETHIEPMRASTHRLGIDLDDVLDAQARVLRPRVAVENVTLAVWTLPTALAPSERQRHSRLRSERILKGPRVAHGQHFQSELQGLVTLHGTLTAAVIKAMRGYNITLLDVVDALRVMRSMIDLDLTSATWVPALLPHTALVPAAGRAETDASYIAPPPIAEQVAPTPIHLLDGQSLRIGRRVYACAHLVLAPEHIRAFDQLVAQAGNMPWRCAFLMSPGAQRKAPAMMRKTVSAFAVGQGHVRDAYREISSDPAAQLLGLQATFVTWVEGPDTPDNRDLAKVQIARLVRALQTWGNAQADPHVGHPARAFFETIPGALRTALAPAAIAPLDDALHIQPVSRPGAPWNRGGLILRTPDGKIYPVEQFSAAQASWVTLIFASMGGGKSVLANALNRVVVTSPSAETLPYISILDVGPASSGIISLLRSALPPEAQFLVDHRRLRLAVEDAINPLDTGYTGLRRPLPSRRSWLISLLRLFCLPVGSTRPHERVDSMLEALVDYAYELMTQKDARRYTRGVLNEVDEAIDTYRISDAVRTDTTWWELVDVFWALFERTRDQRLQGLAELAQTMAVPVLSDLVRHASADVFSANYGGLVPSTGEPVYKYIQASLSTAIKQYPNLGAPTRVHLQARVIALDLELVMPAGTADSARQGTIMAMVARELTAGRYFVSPRDFDIVEDVHLPAMFRAHHREEAERMLAVPKRIVFDEFHRFSHPSILDQVVTDARMTRRNRIEIMLISQSVLDFPAVLVTLASSIWIASGVNPEAKVLPPGAEEPVRLANLIQTTFGLSEAGITALRLLPKPGADGAHYIVSFRTESGAIYSHQVVLTLPSEEIWAYSTTAEDRALRARLETAVGPKQARALLSKHYPSGTVVPVVDQRRRELGHQKRDEASETVIEALARELLAAGQ